MSTSTSKATLENPSEWLINALVGHQNLAGVKVTPLSALGVGTVYACVNLVARTIATLPLKLMRRLPDGGSEPALDHPLYDLLHSVPNDEMTSAEFRMAVQGHLSLRNNAYAFIERDRAGRVISLIPIHPGDVQAERAEDETLYYRVKGRTVLAADMLHLRTYSQNGLVGSDLVTVVGDVIGLAIALEQNAMAFFGNSSRPGLMLEAPNTLSEPAFERLQAALNENHQGAAQAYKALILEEGLKAARVRSENTDSQFDESRDRQDRAIARIFGVPPHKVGVINAEPRANVEEQNLEFITDTVNSTVVFWEQALRKQLLTAEERREYFFHFSLEGLLRGNVKDRYDAYSKARQWGWLSVDEIRAKENLNPLPDGQGKVYLEPGNMRKADGADLQTTEFKNRLEAYGAAIRAGLLTPTPEDEEALRAQLGLPPLTDDARTAWDERDKGARRPITLTSSGEDTTAEDELDDGDGDDKFGDGDDDGSGEPGIPVPDDGPDDDDDGNDDDEE